LLFVAAGQPMSSPPAPPAETQPSDFGILVQDLALPPEDLASESIPDLLQSPDLARPPSRPRIRAELRLNRPLSKSEVGQIILGCAHEAFGPVLRRYMDSKIELSRTADKLLVTSRQLPPERSTMLEACLNDHSNQLLTAPSNIEIEILEVRSP
jgi:hypothetical protein